VSTKNKDLLKTISDRFIKPKKEENEEGIPTLANAGPVEVKATPIENKTALDVVKIGKDFMVIEIEYNLDTMEAKVLSSTMLDNRVVGLAFQHGRSGLESITNRNKKHNTRNNI
jgi:hypothetical protein